jgi:hypothetical protein
VPWLGADGGFYLFSKEYWRHPRATNVVESPFVAVMLRTDTTKRYKKGAHAEALIWRIPMIAQKKFRRLSEEVYQGKKFASGIVVMNSRKERAARSRLYLDMRSPFGT